MKEIKQIQIILLLHTILYLSCLYLFSKDLIFLIFKGIVPSNFTIAMSLLTVCILFFRLLVNCTKEIYK